MQRRLSLNRSYDSYIASIAVLVEFLTDHFFEEWRFLHLLALFRSTKTGPVVWVWIVSAVEQSALRVDERPHRFEFLFGLLYFASDLLFLLLELLQLLFLLRKIRFKLFQLELPSLEKRRKRFFAHRKAKSALKALQSLLHYASLSIQNRFQLRNIAIFLLLESFRKVFFQNFNLRMSRFQTNQTSLRSLSIWFFTAMSCDFWLSICRCSFDFCEIWLIIPFVASSFWAIYRSFLA